MLLHDQIRQHAVIVNGGSGVLFNGMTDEYSYVFTAKHVVDKVESHKVTNINGVDLEVKGCFLHSDIDCAIILTNYQSLPLSDCTDISDVGQGEMLSFTGFPAVRRESPDKYKLLDGHLTDRSGDEFVVTLAGIPGKNIIEGMSGGGVFHIQENQATLVGIEFSMDGAVQDEFPGRVKGNSIKPYWDMISANGLAPLVPLQLACFSRFAGQIFDFNVIDVTNVARLKAKLLEITSGWFVSGSLPTPHSILLSYSNKLLLEGESTESLKSDWLWVAYLEFLVICSLIDDISVVDNNYIAGQDRKRRIIYSSKKENWLRSLKQILNFAKENLDAHGALVITSPETNPEISPPDNVFEKILDDISTVPNLEPMQKIDSVAENIYTTFKISHLNALHHECVVANEDSFGSEKLVSQQIAFFKSKYHEFFN